MTRYAGIAGILAGVALVGEFVLFAMSGFTPQTFSDPATALPFLRDNGVLLRGAVLFGAAGVAFRTIFVVGLAARLQTAAPTRAAATLYFGLLGGTGHGLVALSFWLGIPMFLALATGDQASAEGGWTAFAVLTSGYEGFGNFLLGLSMMAAGWAISSARVLPVGLGWIAVIAGLATLVRVFATGTPLEVLPMVAFFPSLVLAVVFLVWGGVSLSSATEPAVVRA